MSHIRVEQGSSEWMQERAGCCTGSRVKDALNFMKNGEPSQKRKDYAVELVAERLTGCAAEHYVTREMEFGSANETLAVAAYELRFGVETERCGIFKHDLLDRFLASPDRLVGDDGLIECKVPKSSTHIAWLMAGEIPDEHIPQLLSELACSGRAWVDFVSYDPRLPMRYQLFCKRLYADNKALALLLEGVETFLNDVDALQGKMNEHCPPIAEPDVPVAASEWDGDTYLSDADIDAFLPLSGGAQ